MESITQEAIRKANTRVGFAILDKSGNVTGAKVSYSHSGAAKTLTKCIELGILSGESSDYQISALTGAEYMAITGRYF